MSSDFISFLIYWFGLVWVIFSFLTFTAWAILCSSFINKGNWKRFWVTFLGYIFVVGPLMWYLVVYIIMS